MSNFDWIQDWLTDEERAWLFKYNSPEVLESAMKAQGTDVLCDDPATLRATAEIVIRAREKGTVASGLRPYLAYSLHAAYQKFSRNNPTTRSKNMARIRHVVKLRAGKTLNAPGYGNRTQNPPALNPDEIYQVPAGRSGREIEAHNALVRARLLLGGEDAKTLLPLIHYKLTEQGLHHE